MRTISPFSADTTAVVALVRSVVTGDHRQVNHGTVALRRERRWNRHVWREPMV